MRTRSIRGGRIPLSITIFLSLVAFGCGKVGDPLPPLVSIPETATDFGVQQVGYELRFVWTNPSRNLDQSASIDLDRARISDSQAVVIEVPVSGPGEAQSAVMPAADLVGSVRVYTIQFESRQGRLSSPSASSSITVVEVPGPGSGVEAVVDQNRITLRWDVPEQGAHMTDGYRLYRLGIPFSDSPLIETRFEDTRYQDGESYVYTVVPLRRQPFGWVEGLPFDPLTVTAVDRVAPAAPTGLVLTAFDGGAFVGWSSSPEEDVEAYRVFRRDGPALDFLPVSGIGQTTNAFSDAEFMPGHLYIVTAVDGSGNESPPSLPIGL